MLRVFLCGGTHTQQRISHADLAANPSPLCPHCGLEEETQAHIGIDCPAWELQRAPLWAAVRRGTVDSWPPVTRHCAVFLRRPRWVEWRVNLLLQPPSPLPRPIAPIAPGAMRVIGWRWGATEGEGRRGDGRGGVGLGSMGRWGTGPMGEWGDGRR